MSDEENLNEGDKEFLHRIKILEKRVETLFDENRKDILQALSETLEGDESRASDWIDIKVVSEKPEMTIDSQFSVIFKSQGGTKRDAVIAYVDFNSAGSDVELESDDIVSMRDALELKILELFNRAASDVNGAEVEENPLTYHWQLKLTDDSLDQIKENIKRAMEEGKVIGD